MLKSPGSQILLVEDDALAAVRSKQALTPLHAQVEVAKTAHQALAKAREQDYDAILLDMGLPDMSGLELAIAIRKMADPKRSQVPIVVLTGQTSNLEYQNTCLAAGIQAVLNKPAQPEQLRAIFEPYVLKQTDS